jgi:hypothetical protein
VSIVPDLRERLADTLHVVTELMDVLAHLLARLSDARARLADPLDEPADVESARPAPPGRGDDGALPERPELTSLLTGDFG